MKHPDLSHWVLYDVKISRASFSDGSHQIKTLWTTIIILMFLSMTLTKPTLSTNHSGFDFKHTQWDRMPSRDTVWLSHCSTVFGGGGSSAGQGAGTSPGGWWVQSETEGSVRQQWRAAGGRPSLSSPALFAECNCPEPSGTAPTPSDTQKTCKFTGKFKSVSVFSNAYRCATDIFLSLYFIVLYFLIVFYCIVAKSMEAHCIHQSKI